MRYRTATLASIILMLLYTVANLANPYLIGVAIDRYIGHSDLAGLAWIVGILILVNVIMWQAQYWQVSTMSWAGQQVLFYLRFAMFSHLQKLRLCFYDPTLIRRVRSPLSTTITALISLPLSPL